MISVGNRDANKGLGLVLGFGGGREMEEAELEEGEACSYNNNNNDGYDASIDPDIALSYIDEKLQHVLGHFQKDFEGGVSAENLGAKFGGYGSFLPTYQRSPAQSHLRSPPKVENHNAPSKSPNYLQYENGHHSSAVSSAAPPSLRPGPASSSTSVPALNAPSIDDSLKEEMSITSSGAEEYRSRHEYVNRRYLSDQKTLKVRIKVGSDNLSTQKNAEIYSGLGLDVSPSSSLDDSPSESEGMDREPQDAPIESPTSIIRVMTSIPVLESQLLSPLPDYLIHLIAKENLLKDSRSVPFSKAYLEATHSLLKGSDSRKGIEKIGGEKKRKSMEKRKFSKEFRSRNNRDARRGFGAIPREVDIDTSACKEIVAETLKLPLLSNSYSSAVDTRGTSKPSDTSLEPCKSAMRDTVSSLMKEESSRPVYTEESGWDENSKAGSTGKIWDRKKESSTDDVAVYPRKDGSCKRDKTLDSVKVDSHALVTRKAVVTELVDPPKQNSFLRVTSHESDGKLAHGKEHESAGIKRKSKGSQSLGDVAAELPKANSSSVSKNKKNAHEENYMNKKETENKLPKYVDEVEDRYREFFGDIESEQDGKKMIVLEMNSEDGPKQCEVVDKTASTVNNALKERSIGKRTGKFSAPEPYRKFVANGALPRGPGPMPDAAQGTTATVLIEENWVCCDKCQKWRLLPLGINPDSLPEKWLCSMLNWLPGMNRCSVSEEETTKALIALYQAPGPASQNNLQINPGCGLSSVTLADVRHPDQTRNFSSHALSHGRKKKQGLKEIPSANEDVNIQLPNSMKKNVQASVRSESLNGMCHSPLGRELDVRQLSKSSDFSAERHKDKQKEKRIMLEHNSDGGDTKSLKKKIKRDSDRDSIRASKKIKTEDLNVTGDDWMSAHGGVPEKRKPSSSNGLLTSLAGKEQSRHNDYSSKDSKSDTKDRPQTSAKKQKDKVKVPVDDATSKKRKLKESLDYQISSGSIPRSDNDIQGSRNFLEEFSENDYKKEKKARISKSEGKASSVSRGSGKSEKKGSRTKNWHLGQDVGSAFSLRSLDGLDSKRDPGLVHPPVAATSSSSKVSGSHKNKGSFHEAKGSPVESVSSSPMRTSARRNLNGKNESPDTELFCIGSPRKCPYDEDDGGFDRSGTIRKGKSIEAQHESLDLPVLDMQDKDFGVLSGGKAKSIVPSPEVENQHYRKPETAEPSLDDERRNDSRHHANGSCSRKSSKGSSSRSKDKNRISKSNYVCEVQDHMPSDEVKPRDGRSKFQEKSGVQLEEDDMRHVERKDSGGKCSENSKKEHQSSVGRHSGPDATCVRDATSTPKQSLLQDCSGERSSKGFVSDKTDQVELVCGKEKLQSLPHSGGVQNETLVRCPRPAHGSHKGNGSDILAADVSQVGEASKMTKLIRKADHQNGCQSISSRHPTAQNGHRARDAQSPARKDSSSQAANNALKEAKDLKHLADRLKNSGSNSEGTGLYFQAALKFLHGASLLESSGCDKQGEFSQSTTIYSSTAKLCEFCAHEYERSKDNAAAALAYKCMEVAYLRVIYSTHSTASRDRHELQTALQMAPPGESPSSSASDVDNVNHPTTVDKVALTKGVSSPQVPVNHVVAPRHRVKFSRLLTFAQDINFAMEASKKSRHAFALASANLGDGQQKDGISSIKRALDFNFQDVVGLLHLVRLAMEVISR